MPDYRWDTDRRRWRDADSGRFVTPRAARDGLEGMIDAGERRMVALGQRLQAGELSLREWQTAVAREVKDLHIAAALSAGGGPPLSAQQWGFAGSQIKKQYGHLARFGAQVETGAQPLDGVFLTRTSMYAHSARGGFEAMHGLVEVGAGATHERNILGAADHCPDCVEATDAGPVPIGTLTPVGSRLCLTRCRCEIEYGRLVDGEFREL